MENVTNYILQVVIEDVPKYTWHDYTLFIIMLTISVLIGIYFACSGNKQSTADEYLLGGKTMGVFEISMSLIASCISGITILAVPADVYIFGVTYGLCAISVVLAILTAYIVFMPVFYKLQLRSTYAYLHVRFGDSVRKLCSALFTISVFLYLPIVIYVPALALAQGTGFNIHMITPIVCGVCVFYTTIGGLKAVVWTDALQFVIMIFSSGAITYLGTVSCGGFQEVLSISSIGERLDIDFDLDLTKRDTFYSGFIGLYFLWLSQIGVGQGCIQKCLALPTIKHVKRTYIVFAAGMCLITGGSVYAGLMLYAKYAGCDPHKSKRITAPDQMLPLFVLEVAAQIPGLPGLFIAGVFSAALSSLSAAMNNLSCTIYQDFLAGYMPKDTSQKKISNILKIIVLIIGAISTALVFVVEKLGNILQLGLSLTGITAGPIFGLFCLGMLVPSATTKSAVTGALGSLICMSWIVFGSQYYKLNNVFKHVVKPISTDNCTIFIENIQHVPISDFEPNFIYRISHYYYVMMGAMLVIIIAFPVIWFTKKDETPVDKDLITPVMHWAIKEKKPYHSVEKAMQLMKTEVN